MCVAELDEQRLQMLLDAIILAHSCKGLAPGDNLRLQCLQHLLLCNDALLHLADCLLAGALRCAGLLAVARCARLLAGALLIAAGLPNRSLHQGLVVKAGPLISTGKILILHVGDEVVVQAVQDLHNPDTGMTDVAKNLHILHIHHVWLHLGVHADAHVGTLCQGLNLCTMRCSLNHLAPVSGTPATSVHHSIQGIEHPGKPWSIAPHAFLNTVEKTGVPCTIHGASTLLLGNLHLDAHLDQ